MRRIEFQPLGKKLRDDRGRRHRHHSANREPRLPGAAADHHERDDDATQDREHHLREAQAEHFTPHDAQLRQAELQPDRKHQEHDAEFSEMARLRVILNGAQRMRSKREADREVSDDRRQREKPARGHRKHGSSQQDQDRLQRGVSDVHTPLK